MAPKIKKLKRQRRGAFLVYLDADLKNRLEARQKELEEEERARVAPGFKVKVAKSDLVRAALESYLAKPIKKTP